MFHDIAIYIVDKIGDLGYIGIFLLMFLESSFFPFPSEVVMIPAGYLASKGEMNIYLALLFGVLGSLTGALFNYYLALYFGRSFLLRYGKYIFLNPESLLKLESFFEKHGEISTFNGRLIPGVRQYISFPAGLAKMNVLKFSLYTSFGAFLWMVVLVIIGYFIGAEQTLVDKYLNIAAITVLIFATFLTLTYIFFYKRNSK
ncbi:MAG: DedA family protein [Campylobacterales bacterium]|nr:DedA family protein [Campylobacterales bacterium]